MKRLPQLVINNITRYLDLEETLKIGNVLKCNVYNGTFKKFNKDIHTWDSSAELGNIYTIKLLNSMDISGCSERTMDIASKFGKLNVVKFLHFNRKEGCTTNAIDYACMNNHFKTVSFLFFNRQEGYTFGKTMNLIILISNIDIVIDASIRYLSSISFENYNIIDEVSKESSEALTRLTNYNSISECYEDTSILIIVYMGAILDNKKYAKLIKGYICKNDDNLDFKRYDNIIKILS